MLVSLDLDDATVWDSAVALGAAFVIFLPDGEEWLLKAIGTHAVLTSFVSELEDLAV